MANRYVKICPASFIVREMRIKTTVRYHLTPVRMAVITKTRITSVAEDVERKEPSCTLVGIQTGAATVETVWKFLKKLKVELTI